MWCVFLSSLGFAQTVPVPEGEIERPRRSFDIREYEVLEEVQAAYTAQLTEADAQMEELRRQLEARAVEQGLVEAGPFAGPQLPAGSQLPEPSSSLQSHLRDRQPGRYSEEELSELSPLPSPSKVQPTLTTTAPPPTPKVTPKGSSRNSGRTVGDTVGPTGSSLDGTSMGGALVFDVPASSASGHDQTTATVVPAGSYMKVRILTGVEANNRDEIPMLTQVDHALVGPNRRRMDLTGCMLVLKVKGDLSTDRVVGEAVELSCVRDSGESVVREVRGYLAGEDSTFGVTGQLITRQGRVIAAGSVATLAAAAGEAVAAAQETRQVITNPLSGVNQEVRNVDGNDIAYIAGSASSDAAGLIAGWYLDYADQLLPSIAVGSGRDVWVVLLSSVELPPLSD